MSDWYIYSITKRVFWWKYDMMNMVNVSINLQNNPKKILQAVWQHLQYNNLIIPYAGLNGNNITYSPDNDIPTPHRTADPSFAGSPVTIIMMEDIHISTAYKFSIVIAAADDGNNGIWVFSNLVTLQNI